MSKSKMMTFLDKLSQLSYYESVLMHKILCVSGRDLRYWMFSSYL